MSVALLAVDVRGGGIAVSQATVLVGLADRLRGRRPLGPDGGRRPGPPAP
ncbi:MAG: hypothetical protein R3C15_17845 [Thermoleophilia bacterium]